MTTECKLTKDGFQVRKWDGDTKVKHRLKKEKGGVSVYDRETKELIRTCATMDEAEDYYWVEPTEPNWMAQLRHGIEIEEGVTVQNFIDAIKKCEEMVLTCRTLFGEDWDNIDTEANRQVFVSFFNSPSVPEEASFHVCCQNEQGQEGLLRDRGYMFRPPDGIGYVAANYKPGMQYNVGKHSMSLLQIMQALFDRKVSRETLYFRKDGGPLRLTNSYGETVDELDVLLHPIELIDEITPCDIFNWVDENEIFKIFLAGYSWCYPIDAFHTEGNLPAKAADLPEDEFSGRLRRCTVKRWMELNEWEENEISVEEWLDFICFGDVSEDARKMYEQDGVEVPAEDHYGVDLSPVYHYSHLPLTIEYGLTINKMPVYSRRGNVKKPGGVVQEFKFCPMTLLEFLDAIYWEISFFGCPDDRDDKWNDISETIAEVKANPEKHLGKSYESAAEMLEDLEKDDED